jgi:hypothetical protein
MGNRHAAVCVLRRQPYTSFQVDWTIEAPSQLPPASSAPLPCSSASLPPSLPPSSPPPHTHTPQVHPRYPNTALRQYCQAQGVAVVAYASLGCGDLLTHPTVVQVAAAAGKTPAQVGHPSDRDRVRIAALVLAHRCCEQGVHARIRTRTPGLVAHTALLLVRK